MLVTTNAAVPAAPVGNASFLFNSSSFVITLATPPLSVFAGGSLTKLCTSMACAGRRSPAKIAVRACRVSGLVCVCVCVRHREMHSEQYDLLPPIGSHCTLRLARHRIMDQDWILDKLAVLRTADSHVTLPCQALLVANAGRGRPAALRCQRYCPSWNSWDSRQANSERKWMPPAQYPRPVASRDVRCLHRAQK